MRVHALARASSTASLVADGIGVPVDVDPRLREIDFGDATAMRESDFDHRFPGHARAITDVGDLEFRWPGGESRREALTRAPAGVEDARSLGGDVLLVGHRRVWALVQAHELGEGMSARTRYRLEPAQVAPLRAAEGVRDPSPSAPAT